MDMWVFLIKATTKAFCHWERIKNWSFGIPWLPYPHTRPQALLRLPLCSHPFLSIMPPSPPASSSPMWMLRLHLLMVHLDLFNFAFTVTATPSGTAGGVEYLKWKSFALFHQTSFSEPKAKCTKSIHRIYRETLDAFSLLKKNVNTTTRDVTISTQQLYCWTPTESGYMSNS